MNLTKDLIEELPVHVLYAMYADVWEYKYKISKAVELDAFNIKSIWFGQSQKPIPHWLIL